MEEAYNALLVTKTEDGGDRTWNGGRFGLSEIKVYDEVQDYLASGRYPETATKVEKGVIRKRAKKFLLVDGVLHYKQSVKGGEQRLRQVRVNNLHCHGRIQGERSYLMILHCVTMYYLSCQVIRDRVAKTRILEACHDDRVGGCHFGRDRTIDKIATRYYWRGIYNDTEEWVSELLLYKSQFKADASAEEHLQ